MTATTSTNIGVCGDYRLVKKLGAGGMGEVFLAEHRITGKLCAVKRIRADRASDPAAMDHLRTESNAMRQLAHRNGVQVLDEGVADDGQPYLAMEFLPGRTLDELVNDVGPLSQKRVVPWLRQLCSVLAEVHQLGLIHRDVKPANVMLIDQQMELDSIRLLDFGLAASIATSRVDRDAEPAFSGSPHYAAPEAAQGVEAMDARSDLYSLGATAYHLLTGRPVFPGTDPLIVIFAHAERTPTPLSAINPEISVDLEAIVMKCLAKQPGERFQSMDELEQALSAPKLVASGTPEVAMASRTTRSDSSTKLPESHAAAATCVNLSDTK